jgi:four helix bundle protein
MNGGDRGFSVLERHQDLVVWQKSMDLVEDVYRASAAFPAAERFGLVSQMRTAAVSVPSNLAEGCGRTGKQEMRRFASIARGSLLELETQVEIATRIGYLSQVAGNLLRARCGDVSRLLMALLRSLG